jgi:hypothetical protein
MQSLRKISASLFVWVVVLTGCTIWAQKPLSWGSVTGAEGYERLMWQEIKAGNAKEIERRLASTFTMIDPSGRVLDKPTALAEMKSLAIADFSVGEFNVTPNGEDMVVTYTAEVNGTWQGQPLRASRLRVMTVWQQADKGWQAIASSSQIIEQELR